jgi:uncharacterized protein Yka (UPF0111/DUF47 family)
MENVSAPKWLTKFFSPRTNFYNLLYVQAQKTLEGIEALSAWIEHGALEKCESVRQCEREADQLVLDLEEKLVNSFVTPFDREDIHDLSFRLDEVINCAKTTVREIEALEVKTIGEHSIRELAQTMVEGTRCLEASLKMMEKNLSDSYEQAVLARRCENRSNKIYGDNMKGLFALEDPKQIQKIKEVYNCLLSIAHQIDEVGVKIMHVIVKLR